MDDATAQRIVETAIDCFSAAGFAGTTLREIAAGANVAVARIYEHYASKQALLSEIVNAAYDGLLAQAAAALADAEPNPAAQLDAVVWAQCDFHARHVRASWVAQTEARCLTGEDRLRVATKRRRVQRMIAEILNEAEAQGLPVAGEIGATSRALVSMCAAIASWHDPAGVQAPRQIAGTYCELAARMTGLQVPDAGAPSDRLAVVESAA